MLVVITGGPYSGKTTLVEALGQRGYRFVREAAIQVIEELGRELGIEEQKRWRAAHRAEFQARIVRRQIDAEREVLEHAREEPVFLDRSRVDGLGYCRHFGEEPPAELSAAIDELRYDRVFLLDTLSRVEVRGDTGRTSDREASLAIAKSVEAVYLELGYEPVRVPELPLAERVDLVLRELGLESGATLGR